MGQRYMRNTSPMFNLELDQQAQFHPHPEPRLFSGGISNYPQPIIHPMVPVAGPMPNFDNHHLTGSCENATLHGMTGYNRLHHNYLVRNPGLGPATASSYYNPYMIPSGSSVSPPQINQGSFEQYHSGSNHFFDGFGGAYKRKSAEGFPAHFQYFNPSAGPSSAMPLIMEVGSHRGVRPVAVEADTIAHNPNHLIQGNYPGQALISTNTPWVDQRFSTNGGDGGTWTWSQAPAITYIHGSSVNGGFTGAGNMVADPFQEVATHISPANFQHPPPIYQGHPNVHHLPHSMQGARSQNVGFYSQVPGLPVPYIFSRNGASHTNTNPSQEGLEVRPGYVGAVPPTGLVVYHPQGTAALPEATIRHHGLPHLSILPADEVAMLEIPGYYEIGNAVDQHRDLRLDVDNMSYEELLALEDRIGYVTTGLSENTVLNHLKTRTHISSTDSTDLEDQETDFCVICQTNYENGEKIGTLNCGHEYHADCVKRWLIIKNICPICKCSALTTKRKDSTREG